MQTAPIEYSAILSTFIKLPFVFKTFVLSIFEWRLKTGLTVFAVLFIGKLVMVIVGRTGDGYCRVSSWVVQSNEDSVPCSSTQHTGDLIFRISFFNSA